MQAGECWYLDLGLPHRVVNAGTEARVHLVLDCEPNAWLCGVLEAAGVSTAVAPRVHSPEATARILEELRRLGTDAALAAAEALGRQAQPS